MIQAGQEVDIGEIVLHHTADAYSIDFYPLGKVAWHRWPDTQLGPLTVNLTPTKHVVFLALAALLVFLTMKLAGRSLARQRAGENAPRGFAAAVEGPLTSMIPASAMQLHPHATVVIDEAAASRLRLYDYYRSTWAAKPAWQHI